jgi:hypothetical protein
MLVEATFKIKGTKKLKVKGYVEIFQSLTRKKKLTKQDLHYMT